jgi:hypothetical protein
LTTKELFSRSRVEILSYIESHKRKADLGLDRIVVASLDDTYRQVMKKSDIILVGWNSFLIYSRYDNTSHLCISINFGGAVSINIKRFEYITGRLLESQRITE